MLIIETKKGRNMERYITQSLELHLFFARIMKEHALFLEAGFTPANPEWGKEAEFYKNVFEDILAQAIHMGCGQISPNVLNSGELVTPYTLETENKTSRFTNISINFGITKQEQMLISNNCTRTNTNLSYTVKNLNQKALYAVNQLIQFKERILNDVLTCKAFTMNYPLLIEHILREANLYRSYIIALENGQDIRQQDMREVELFWNQIMMEHALFIRGLLDPTEEDLIHLSNDFAEQYKQLLQEAQTANDTIILKNKTIEETMKYRDFKETGTKGISSCQIKSIILPLLADHVLREANHYLRILSEK